MRLMLDGKIPSKDELLKDELVAQMIDEAKAEGAKTAPTKDIIVQALTPDELKGLEPVKQMIATAEETGKKSIDRAAVIQSLKIEDVKDLPVVAEVIEEKLKMAKITKEMFEAIGSGTMVITPAGKEGHKSMASRHYAFLSGGSLE